MRRAKIVATVGPATQTRNDLESLIKAGMNVARLNFSHGHLQGHLEVLQTIRQLSRELGRPVAILQDLQGIKIRTGTLKGGRTVELKKGSSFTLTTQDLEGDSTVVSTSYSRLPEDVNLGDRILLSDGLIELEVQSTGPGLVNCQILTGGRLAERQGINIPNAVISAPALTQKDIEDLEFGIEQGVDFIALSFVRSAQDMLTLKDRLAEKKVDIPVIAKLEKPAAIDNLEEILEASAGVMVARGDLGVEVSPEQVPVIQKRVIREANRRNKLVITATQMLDSMIRSPRPTRAEASDVANAIFDGTDAVMLSGETAVGKFPIRAVEMMNRIIVEAEKMRGEYPPPQQQSPAVELGFPQAVCDAAYHVSKAIDARAVVAFTQSGATAQLISMYRPDIEIIGLTPRQRIVHRMSLYWGVRPLRMHEINNVDELILELDRLLMKRRLVRKGDKLIILTGAPLIEKGQTSLMKLHIVKGN